MSFYPFYHSNEEKLSYSIHQLYNLEEVSTFLPVKIADNRLEPVITRPERKKTERMHYNRRLILVPALFLPFSKRDQDKILTSQEGRADEGTRTQNGDTEDKASQGKMAVLQSSLGSREADVFSQPDLPQTGPNKICLKVTKRLLKSLLSSPISQLFLYSY